VQDLSAAGLLFCPAPFPATGGQDADEQQNETGLQKAFRQVFHRAGSGPVHAASLPMAQLAPAGVCLLNLKKPRVEMSNQDVTDKASKNRISKVKRSEKNYLEGRVK
jgi:hypothetical protein